MKAYAQYKRISMNAELEYITGIVGAEVTQSDLDSAAENIKSELLSLAESVVLDLREEYQGFDGVDVDVEVAVREGDRY